MTASNCPLPCVTFSTETKSTLDFDGSLGFGVTFQSTVEVNTKHIVFREQKESRILGEFPSFVIFHVFVKVTKTVMMTPTLTGIMSDV